MRPSLVTRSVGLDIYAYVIIGMVCYVIIHVQGFAMSSTRATTTDETMLEKVLYAVELAQQFLTQDYSRLNLDGLFGIRIGQGQIAKAMSVCQESAACPESVLQRIQAVNESIEKAARASMSYVQDQDPAYFERFLEEIDSPYILDYRSRTFTDPDKFPIGQDTWYNEETGDRCFGRLLGTYVEDNRKVERCTVVTSCWEMMTKENTASYSVTHQLLYFIIMEKAGCIQKVQNSTGVQVPEIEERLCGSIYNEARRLVIQGDVEPLKQDLFLEQVLLCGILGFENFIQRDWIQMVLRWQSANGCFTLPDKLLKWELGIINIEAEQQIMQDLKKEAQMIQQQKQPRQTRKLLREEAMEDGCLSHKSGLGFADLCLYLHGLLRALYLTH